MIDHNCFESFDEKCGKLLEKYLDPTEEMTTDEYLRLAQCLLLAYRDCGMSVEFAEKFLNFVVKVVKLKIESKEIRGKIEEYMKNVPRGRINVYLKWLKEGIQVVGAEACVSKLVDNLFIQAFVGGVIKLSLILIPVVDYYMMKRYIRKIAVAIESLAKKVVALKLEEFAERLPAIAHDEFEELKKEDIFVNTPEVLAFAEKLFELKKEVFRSI